MNSTEIALGADRSWGRVRLLFCFLVTAAILCWRWQALDSAFQLNHFRPQFFLPDLFQEWASARNVLDGFPLYSPHAESVPRLLGLSVDSSDPYFTILKENSHPPYSTLAMMPLAALDFPHALALWKILSLGLLVISLWLIADALNYRVAAWQILAGSSALLLCYPFEDQLLHGQLTFLLLFLLTMAWRADRCERSAAAGIWAATATALKLYPGLFLLYFLILRKWRSLAWAGLTGLTLTFVAGLVLGPDSFSTFVFDVTPRTAEVRGRWDNYSLFAIPFKLFDKCEFPSIFVVQPVRLDRRLAWAAALLLVLLFLAVTAYLVRGSVLGAGDSDRAFALTVSAMVLASPIAWDHNFLLLILPLLIVWPRLDRLGRQLLISLLVILSAPPWKVVQYASILFFGSAQSSGPWQTLTALSIPCYAQLGVFMLIASAPLPAKTPAAEPVIENDCLSPPEGMPCALANRNVGA